MDVKPACDRRYLLVNADDFGYSTGINRGIVQAHQRGVVTSASVMVRQRAANEAIVAARDCPGLCLGLHVDLGEWAFRNGKWIELYRVVNLDEQAAVEREIQRQLELFEALTGRRPTHLDSHQHVHRQEPVRSVVNELADQLAVPLRHESSHVQYCGAFYGQTATGEAFDDAISVESLISLLKRLPAGVSELGCHPGFGDDLNTMYARQRSIEVATLCSPDVRMAIAELGIELISFRDLALTAQGISPAALRRGALALEEST